MSEQEEVQLKGKIMRREEAQEIASAVIRLLYQNMQESQQKKVQLSIARTLKDCLKEFCMVIRSEEMEEYKKRVKAVVEKNERSN